MKKLASFVLIASALSISAVSAAPKSNNHGSAPSAPVATNSATVDQHGQVNTSAVTQGSRNTTNSQLNTTVTNSKGGKSGDVYGGISVSAP